MVSLDIKRDILTTTDRNWSPATHIADGPFTDSLTEQPRSPLTKSIRQCLSWAGSFCYEIQHFITIITEAHYGS